MGQSAHTRSPGQLPLNRVCMGISYPLHSNFEWHSRDGETGFRRGRPGVKRCCQQSRQWCQCRRWLSRAERPTWCRCRRSQTTAASVENPSTGLCVASSDGESLLQTISSFYHLHWLHSVHEQISNTFWLSKVLCTVLLSVTVIYINVACCYRQSSMVCPSVCLSWSWALEKWQCYICSAQWLKKCLGVNNIIMNNSKIHRLTK